MKTYTIQLTEEQRRAVVTILSAASVKGASAKAFVALMEKFTNATPDQPDQPNTTNT